MVITQLTCRSAAASAPPRSPAFFFSLEKPQVADITYLPGDQHSFQGRWGWRGEGRRW